MHVHRADKTDGRMGAPKGGKLAPARCSGARLLCFRVSGAVILRSTRGETPQTRFLEKLALTISLKLCHTINHHNKVPEPRLYDPERIFRLSVKAGLTPGLDVGAAATAAK